MSGDVTDQLVTRSTSRSTAEANDIVLRENQITRLVFRPVLIGTNKKNPDALVNGNFIFQRKSRLGHWEPVSAESLASLKGGEIRKLELHANELLILVRSVEGLYELVRQHGIKLGKTEWVKTPESVLLRGLIQQDDFLKEALGSKESGLVAQFIQALAQTPASALEQLEALQPTELTNVAAILGAAKLSLFLRTYKENTENGNEQFWHSTLQNNAWVISQIFASPMIIVRGQSFVGGKSLGNKGGKLVDFAYKNKLTKNLLLVEIKTPLTALLDKRPYRDGVYRMSAETIGSIAQVLTQKSSLVEELASLQKNAKVQGEEEFEAFRPRALVITGSFEQEQLNPAMVRSFELFRNELRDVELITFDELAQKISDLLALLGVAASDETIG